MAAWPQNSIRPGAVPATCDRRGRPSLSERRAQPQVGRCGELTATVGAPVREQARIASSNAGCRPQVPDISRRKPGNPVWPLFRTDSRPFIHEIGFSGCLQTVSGLLHSWSAFGIALPLTASDRRHLGCGCSSVVEHDLAKVGVEGSSPFARSRFSWHQNRLCTRSRVHGFSFGFGGASRGARIFRTANLGNASVSRNSLQRSVLVLR